MARQESDREDLMREATALVRRVELDVPDEPDVVIAGFRSNGWTSIYFGADPVFHLDERQRLRRAFVGDCLYRTQGVTLARLARMRSESASELRRDDLNTAELTEFRAQTGRRLNALLQHLRAGGATIRRSVPADADLRPELCRTIEQFLGAGQPLSPAIPGKK